MPLASAPKHFGDFQAYASLLGYDDSYQYYGAFYRGQQVGYAAAKDKEIVHVSAVNDEVTQGLLSMMYVQGNERINGDILDPEILYKSGFVNTLGRRFAAGKGKSPKDMIEGDIPFIYDVHKKHIQIGYAGEQHRDIQPYRGEFSKGGIVEGTYAKGGKMTIYPSNTRLFATYDIAKTWYDQFPQMEITGLEVEQDGKKHKVAASDTMGSQMNPGEYIKVLTAADPAASKAYEALKNMGGKVYVVGGAVRDVLRGEEPNDIDLMVAGIPTDEVAQVLKQLPGTVKETGKRFGVYRYRHDGHEVEIALPRQDKYETAQRGKGVITVDHNLPLEKDLERRDFTINSMAVDLDNGEIIDPHGGQNDLEKNVLRTTHPDSFSEDPTRLVRALTAHSRFGVNPDEQTRHEMASNAHLLQHESPDALNKTLDKFFASPHPASGVRLAKETGVLDHLFPEVANNWDFDQQSKYHNLKLGEHSNQVLDNISKESTDPDLRLAGLLHDVGKPASSWMGPDGHLHFYKKHFPDGTTIGEDHAHVGAKMVEDRMRKLNYPVARINRVTHIVNNHMFPRFTDQKGARKFLQRVGDEHADDLLTHHMADSMGKGDDRAAAEPVNHMRSLVDEVRKSQQATDVSNLAVNGNDLMQAGIPQGPQVGQVLRNLLDHVVSYPQDNNHEKLIQLAQGYAPQKQTF